MTTLHERLAELAEDAPPGWPAPDLWDRGRRIARRRRFGTAVIVCAVVVLLTLLAGATWQRSAPVPAPAGGPVGLPDRVWKPSPWLPSTDRPGRLVAVSSVDRGTWTGTRAGVVGISATSGKYAFLDLPDAPRDTVDVELAPDGRHVAYWLTGPTTGERVRDGNPITGVAVYDVETGEVDRHRISTAHGVYPQALAWADADTLVFVAGTVVDASSSMNGRLMAWPLGGLPRLVPALPGAYVAGASGGWVLSEHRLVDVAEPRGARRIDYDDSLTTYGSMHPIALGPDANQIALLSGVGSPSRLQAGPAGRLRIVPGSKGSFGSVGWLDDDTIVAWQRVGDRWQDRTALVRRSVSTGASSVMVRFPAEIGAGSWQFATDLLDAPSTPGVEPPTPLDPRLVAGLAVAVVLAGGCSLMWWRRRRVRP